MPKKVTTKSPLFGNRRSHALNATRHAQKPNLQKITLEDGTAVRISARELRTLKKGATTKKEIEVVNNTEAISAE